MEATDTVFTTGIIDKQVYNRLIVFDDPIFLQEITHVFTNQSIVYLDQLDLAFSKKDFIEIRKILHNLQSSCGTVGASKMVSSILKIRALAKAEEVKNMAVFIKQLKSNYNETTEALNHLKSVLK
ncbi:MAG: hypothetical protein CMO01_07930 [Thalassobius sp.]|nr:hypothetical protein [Thalassovita sp.]|tara:strand:+ start:325 stop:699 length:375 start_codon:yes stop_codon:yes gene_type:complete